MPRSGGVGVVSVAPREDSGVAARPLSILHVVAPAQAGGLEEVVVALAAGHAARGHTVRVLTILDRDDSRDPLTRRLPAAGVEVVPAVLAGRAYARERAAVARACAAFRPDVVHTHGYRPDVLDGGVARRLGIPTVTTVHGFTGGDWKNRLYERLQVRAFRRFDAVVAVSRPIVERLARAGVPRQRIHLLPNAWAGRPPAQDRAAARRSLGVPLEGFRIGWVGRLTAEKGADVLVEAVARLGDVPVSVSVIGDGRERGPLEQRARELGIADRIAWHGLVADAAGLYRAFDVFVLSSRTEGTPIALFEAMAAGVPVVATHVGGVPDVVSPGEALLVPAEDPDALASAIRAVLEDPAAAAARAAAARARLERAFGREPWLDRYEMLYRGLAPAALMTPATST